MTEYDVIRSSGKIPEGTTTTCNVCKKTPAVRWYRLTHTDGGGADRWSACQRCHEETASWAYGPMEDIDE